MSLEEGLVERIEQQAKEIVRLQADYDRQAERIRKLERLLDDARGQIVRWMDMASKSRGTR